jgi:hypothetical protein
MTACIPASGSPLRSRFNQRKEKKKEPLNTIFSRVRGRGAGLQSARVRHAKLFQKVYLSATRLVPEFEP